MLMYIVVSLSFVFFCFIWLSRVMMMWYLFEFSGWLRVIVLLLWFMIFGLRLRWWMMVSDCVVNVLFSFMVLIVLRCSFV